jgi:hypothetical protein
MLGNGWRMASAAESPQSQHSTWVSGIARLAAYAVTGGAMAVAYLMTRSSWVEFLALLVAFLVSTEVAIRAEGRPRRNDAEADPPYSRRRWWLRGAWYAAVLFALDDAPTFGWGGSRGLYGFALIIVSIETSIFFDRRRHRPSGGV